jgi:hypothetical protein
MPLYLLAARAADVVHPCPPLFRPSHHGCEPAPLSPQEIVVACAVFLAVALVAVVAIVVGRSKRDGE